MVRSTKQASSDQKRLRRNRHRVYSNGGVPLFGHGHAQHANSSVINKQIHRSFRLVRTNRTSKKKASQNKRQRVRTKKPARSTFGKPSITSVFLPVPEAHTISWRCRSFVLNSYRSVFFSVLIFAFKMFVTSLLFLFDGTCQSSFFRRMYKTFDRRRFHFLWLVYVI